MDHASRVDRTALVVDDDVFMLSALAELLEEEGYDVHTASNGFSALRQVQAFKPAVVLLDLALPERSGAEVLLELRADVSNRDIAIVVVTGHPDSLSEVQAAEIDGFVTKPFDAVELLRTVHRAVQHAAARRSEVAPVAATSHRGVAARTLRPASARHTRGRR